MTVNIPFSPSSTQSISVSGSSQAVTITTSTVVRLANNSENVAFFKFGSTATTSDTPILPGVTEVFSNPVGNTSFAAIGTDGTLYVTSGEGM